MIARILLALLPIAVDIGKAMRKDSPGGKKITEEELLGILLRRTPDVAAKLNE